MVKLGYCRKRHLVLCLVKCKPEPVNANIQEIKQFSIVLQSSPDWILVRIFRDGMENTRLATILGFILSGFRMGARSSAAGGSTVLQAGRSGV
jgi:hypothetical protein